MEDQDDVATLEALQGIGVQRVPYSPPRPLAQRTSQMSCSTPVTRSDPTFSRCGLTEVLHLEVDPDLAAFGVACTHP
jgi:hypothetical protein